MRFPDRARVCFIGDSLTAHNQILPRVIDHYNKYFADADVRFFNCGTSGGTYQTAVDFFYDDVLPHRPTHAVVAFGVNDSGRWWLEQPRCDARYQKLLSYYHIFQSKLKEYCDLLTSHGIAVTLCTPAPYDEYTPTSVSSYHGGFALIAEYANFVRAYAKEKGVALCDYHAFITAQLQTDSLPIFTEDHVHPNPHGYYLMAKYFLSTQGLEMDGEDEIPTYFQNWRDAVQKLRTLYGAEQMVIHNYAMPIEDKVALIEKKIATEDWGERAFEPFIRAFKTDYKNKLLFYKQIDEIYEKEVFKRYQK